MLAARASKSRKLESWQEWETDSGDGRAERAEET